MPVITLTTDFGTRDWFVGSMKGVILGLNPAAGIVDLTHEVPPGDIRSGAWALAAGCRDFPAGSIHVAVVDPGVGGARQAIAVRTARYRFIGPDNGLLALALRQEQVREVRRLTNQALFRLPLSRTFHGRDLFAPVAARLSAGLAFGRLGPPTKHYVELDFPEPRTARGVLEGAVVYLDRFGNALTNLSAQWLAGWELAACRVWVRGRVPCPFGESYGAVPEGKPVAVLGSTGRLEIALNRGSAAEALGIRVGDRVTIRRANRRVERGRGRPVVVRRGRRDGDLTF
jgi:hypothetical protein